MMRGTLELVKESLIYVEVQSHSRLPVCEEQLIAAVTCLNFLSNTFRSFGCWYAAPNGAPVGLCKSGHAYVQVGSSWK